MQTECPPGFTGFEVDFQQSSSLAGADPTSISTPSIAILIPCYNEEATIGQVVRRLRSQLSDAAIYVCDNNSSDETVAEARQAGAVIMHEARQGKGYAVRSMFRQINADIYVLVDGDGTYPSVFVHALIKPVLSGEADMVVGSRLHRDSRSQFRTLNKLGNRFFTFILNSIFRTKFTDILSGYRVFSKSLVSSLSLTSAGFDIEPEITVKALARGARIVEVPVDLRRRPKESFSKIKLIWDGFLILYKILFFSYGDSLGRRFPGAAFLSRTHLRKKV